MQPRQSCVCTTCARQYYKSNLPMKSLELCRKCNVSPGCVPSTIYHAPNQLSCLCSACIAGNHEEVTSRRLLSYGVNVSDELHHMVQQSLKIHDPSASTSHQGVQLRRLLGTGHNHRPFPRPPVVNPPKEPTGYYHWNGNCEHPINVQTKCAPDAFGHSEALAVMPTIECPAGSAIVSFMYTQSGCSGGWGRWFIQCRRVVITAVKEYSGGHSNWCGKGLDWTRQGYIVRCPADWALLRVKNSGSCSSNQFSWQWSCGHVGTGLSKQHTAKSKCVFLYGAWMYYMNGFGVIGCDPNAAEVMVGFANAQFDCRGSASPGRYTSVCATPHKQVGLLKPPIRI